jgi:hypothetical protein
MAAVRVAGTCFLKRDGVQYSLMGSLTIQPLSLEREGVSGLDGIHGFSERSVVPYIEAEITKTPELSLSTLEGVTDSTITAECADGTVYVLRNAWFAGLAELDAGEGKVTVKFEGLACNEI